jgi:5'-nucleotidase
MLTRRTLLVSTAAGMFRPWRFLGGFAPPSLAILHTNDVHGRVFLEGQAQGLGYLASEIRRQRLRYAASLTLDAGDIIHGTPMEQRHGPQPVLSAFNAIGYDAATVGNHEFDFGPENLRNASRFVKFPLLSANVRTQGGEPWGPLKPYTLVERAGRRIGIFGLTTTLTPDIQWPRTIESIRFEEPHAHARKLIAELRPKVDLLICLSHLGYEPDQKLAHEAPGIDLIVGGHSHTRLNQAKIENGVPIVQTGAHGKALGVVEVRFEGGKPLFETRLIDATEGKDPQVEAVYAPREAKLTTELQEVLTTLPAAMSFVKIASESPEGRFLPEAVRVAHKADIGLFATSQISRGLDAGQITRKDVYACMTAYTRQHIVRMRVPAALYAARIATAKEILSAGTPKPTALVAGPAHVMQSLFLGQPGVEIVYDDPLGPTVRDAVMNGFKAGLASQFLQCVVA